MQAFVRIMAGMVLALAAQNAAHASECPGNPRALGTSRVMTVNPTQFARIGTIQYDDTLPLRDKEVVLTFDDGPMPPYTTRVLEILAGECVKANYFIIGRMARGYPDLLRRIHNEGHVIGTHSQNHPLAFDRMTLPEIRNEIEQGIASVASALGNAGAVAPFFRIPGLLRAPGVERYVKSRELMLWSADITGDDWKHITSSEVVKRVMSRLNDKGRGVVLLHDIQPATALALPELIRQLKRGGYRIVQVAPAGYNGPAIAARPGTGKPEMQLAAVAATPPAPVQAASSPSVAPLPPPVPPALVAQPASRPAPPPFPTTLARPQPPQPAPPPEVMAPSPVATPPAMRPAAAEPAPPPYVRAPPDVAAAPPPYVQAQTPAESAAAAARSEQDRILDELAANAPPAPQASETTPTASAVAPIADGEPRATATIQQAAPQASEASAQSQSERAASDEPGAQPTTIETVIVVPANAPAPLEADDQSAMPFAPGLKASQSISASAKLVGPPG